MLGVAGASGSRKVICPIESLTCGSSLTMGWKADTIDTQIRYPRSLVRTCPFSARPCPGYPGMKAQVLER